jgi:hypothetical protein
MNADVHAPASHIRKRIVEFLLIAAAIFLVIASLHLTGCATTSEKEGAEAAAKEESLAEKWGIEITSIRMTANDHMIDFRYKVLDEEKAKELFVRENKPYLIEQASGKVLAVPVTAKVGPLRSSYNPQKGRIYWMFFGNTRGLVKSGSKVSVVIGEFRAENLVVQ